MTHLSFLFVCWPLFGIACSGLWSRHSPAPSLPFSPFFLRRRPLAAARCLDNTSAQLDLKAFSHGHSLSLCSGAIRQNIGQCRCPGIGHEVRTLTSVFSLVRLYVCLPVCLSVCYSEDFCHSDCMLCQAIEEEQRSALADRCCCCCCCCCCPPRIGHTVLTHLGLSQRCIKAI